MAEPIQPWQRTVIGQGSNLQGVKVTLERNDENLEVLLLEILDKLLDLETRIEALEP